MAPNSNTPTYVALHGSYSSLQLAFCKGEECLSVIKQDDVRASSHLITYLDSLLSQHATRLQELDFFVVDYGPGAFTSLRVTIAAVNGLGFAVQTKLIPVSGLDALLMQISEDVRYPTSTVHVALLNAYNNEVYYRINAAQSDVNNAGLQGYGFGPAEELFVALEQEFGSQVVISFAGNGAVLHTQAIKQRFNQAIIIADLLVPSIETIARLGLQQWQAGATGTTRITPLYLKTQLFAIKK